MKYVKAKATAKTIASIVEEGYAQIDTYASGEDVVAMLTETWELKAGELVFVGLKDVKFFPWPRPAKKAATKKRGWQCKLIDRCLYVYGSRRTSSKRRTSRHCKG